MKCVSWSVVVVVSALGILYEARAATPAGEPVPTTHKQARVIKPRHEGRDVTLMAFALAKDGDLWMSVSTAPRHAGSLPKVPGKSFSGIQVYSPEGELKAEYPLEFQASAISFAPDGSLFAAGQGKLAHLSASGEALAQAATPNIGDVEEYKKKIYEQTKKQNEQYVKQYDQQLQAYDKIIERIEGKDEADRSGLEKAQLDAYKQQRKQMQSIIKSLESRTVDPETAMLNHLVIPGLAASEEYVFVVVRSAAGRGYEVWRTGHDFADGELVKSGLSGCCGNMDIQPRGAGFVACENTKFEVVSYSPEGKRLASFGKRDRTAPDGFGSCCNPMNCLSLDNGEYVVAESSIGNIKRFDADGNFLGIVGKARITGGCKHVALGFDAKRNRYYMQNEDKNHICVLLPLDEAPEVTAEERKAKEARAGLGQKLIGRWEPAKPQGKEPKQPQAGLVINAGTQGDIDARFLEDGTAKLEGGIFQHFTASNMAWECVEQQGQVLTIALLMDGIEFQTFRVRFDGDDQLQFEGSGYFPAGKTYKRVIDSAEASAANTTGG